jgi:hypothetical protein
MENPTEDNVLIEDIDQFINITMEWHGNRVAEVEHMLSVPEGTVMELNGVDIPLTGDMHKGFVAGLTVALMRLGSLPFIAVPEPLPASEVAPLTH